MARMLGNNASAFESARSQFWIVDAKVSSDTPKFCHLLLCHVIMSLSHVCWWSSPEKLELTRSNWKPKMLFYIPKNQSLTNDMNLMING